MAEITYPRLCGGTFVTLLLDAKKDPDIYRKHGKGGKNTHRNHDLVAGLININKPQNKSKQLVEVLNKEIFSAIEISRSVRKNIFLFKNELESYNELLVKYLAVKNDCFVFDSEFDVNEDTNHTKESWDYDLEAVSKKLNFNIESVEIIPICDDEDIDTELNNIGSNYMAFHLATRIRRIKINALFKEIQDEINSLPNV